ncbi:MAG: efflux RND transporter permease subunit [Verrucomicrobia bacterium]|nr:efflux RND transporter permease subunit [Verrucomicrobiota bacterium]
MELFHSLGERFKAGLRAGKCHIGRDGKLGIITLVRTEDLPALRRATTMKLRKCLRCYGNVASFTMQLQNRSGGSVDQLAEQVQRFVAEASKRPEIGRLTTTFQPATPQLNVVLDREKARAQGVKVDSVFQTLQAYLSGLYVNDIVRFGRVFKVFLQAEPEFTYKPDQIGKFYVRNQDGNQLCSVSNSLCHRKLRRRYDHRQPLRGIPVRGTSMSTEATIEEKKPRKKSLH